MSPSSCDAGYQTWLLTHWGRDREALGFPAELIRRLTSDTARAAGLARSRRSRRRQEADVNIIDWDRLGADAPYVVSDLPAGGKRLLQPVTATTRRSCRAR